MICCSAAILFLGCQKNDFTSLEQDETPVSLLAENRILPGDVNARDTISSISLFADGCNCVPLMTVKLETGVLVVQILNSEYTSCKKFQLETTLNGGAKDQIDVNTEIQKYVILDQRFYDGQTVSGSVQLRCMEEKCRKIEHPNPAQKCVRSVSFSLKDTGESGPSTPGCGRTFNTARVSVPERGTFVVEVQKSPVSSSLMNPDSYIIYYTDRQHDEERSRGSLSVGLNTITFYAGAGSEYWIKLYNSAICGDAMNHYLQYPMYIASDFVVATEINNH